MKVCSALYCRKRLCVSHDTDVPFATQPQLHFVSVSSSRVYFQMSDTSFEPQAKRQKGGWEMRPKWSSRNGNLSFE